MKPAKKTSYKSPCEGCIYLLRNKVNGKGYVGQHKNVSTVADRWAVHVKGATRGDLKPLRSAIRIYSWDNFSREVIWVGELAKLNEKETYYIKKLHTFIDDSKGGGYNLTTGGEGYVRSKRTRQLLSTSVRQSYAANPSLRASRTATNLRRYEDLEERQKSSERTKQYWADTANRRKMIKAFNKPEVVRKNKEAQLRRYEDPLERQKSSEVQRRPETRKKKSKAARRQFKDPKARKALSRSARLWQKQLTEERRAEINRKKSEAHLRRWALMTVE